MKMKFGFKSEAGNTLAGAKWNVMRTEKTEESQREQICKGSDYKQDEA